MRKAEQRIRYAEFCCHTEGLPLFAEAWWLDAVCGAEGWQVALDFDKNGNINGALTYQIVKKWGIKIIQMPPQTGYMNLWLRDDAAWKTESHLRFQRTVLKNLIAQLPSDVAYFNQFLPPSFQNFLPFRWANFHIEPHVAYVLDDLKNTSRLWENLKDTARNKIRKAEKAGISVESSLDFERFYAIFEKNYQRLGVQTRATRQFFERIHAEIKKQNVGKVFFATDTEGSVHAALYVVWSNSTAIYWAAAADENHRTSGATSLLLWRVLENLSARGIQRFEALGSGAENLESFIASFGARQEVFFKISRYRNRFFQQLHLLITH